MHLSRRTFLEASAAAMAAPAEPKRKLSLSVRVAEAFDNKEKSSMKIEELIGLAKSNGYSALCMRASQAGIQTPPEITAEIGSKIRASGLGVSMVTGDFAVPKNDDQGPNCLRNIKPYLDLAERFGASLIRVCMKKDEDMEWARRASDEAAERKIRLAHQSHCASLFETIEGTLRVLKAVDRPNFGLIFEPANCLIAGEDYSTATIERLKPYLFNVYVQNHRLNPQGTAVVQTWKRGPVRLDHIGLWEKGGVAYDEFLASIRRLGYQGFVTVHQAFEGVMSVEEAVKKSAAYLKPRIA